MGVRAGFSIIPTLFFIHRIFFFNAYFSIVFGFQQDYQDYFTCKDSQIFFLDFETKNAFIKKIPKRKYEKNNSMGPLRFELRTSAMSRRRHSQLDHEPAEV